MVSKGLRLVMHAALFILVIGAGMVGARAEKPPKIPVAMGTWTGPHAGTFKSAVRSGVSKDCSVVKANKARVIIDGEVTEAEKGFTVHVTVKSPKTNEIVESREYSFSKPQVSQAQTHKMGHDVTEIARRAPE
jgi:hypothetical protein